MKKINILFPVLNEELRLADGINKTMEFLKGNDFMPFELNIIDNGSTDKTQQVAESLCAQYPEVHYTRITERGTGIAIREGVKNNTCDFVGYMDVDLSTNLKHLLQVQDIFLKMPEVEFVNGSRFSKESSVSGRKWYRNLTSYGLLFLLHFFLKMKASDAICGFKFFKKETVEKLVESSSKDENGWFFIIEMLLRAERMGVNIYELPVEWADDSRTKVKLFATLKNYIRNIRRLRKVLK
ncbi:MAG: glycosyltransferase [Bacteroidales bacterium]|nr:glycosyltransferase [Bacteroidales bacterium]